MSGTNATGRFLVLGIPAASLALALSVRPVGAPASLDRAASCPGQVALACEDALRRANRLHRDHLEVQAHDRGRAPALPKPQAKLSIHRPRQPGPEQKTYRVRAALVKMKKEDDGDYHLVIADPGPNGKQMVVEFRDPNCDGAMQSKKRASMASARKALRDHCGTPPTSFKKGMLSGTATVKGVGFFDFLHAGDQAENGSSCTPLSASGTSNASGYRPRR